MNKVLVFGVSAMLTVAVLGGCGSKSDTSQTTTTTTTIASTTTEANTSSTAGGISKADFLLQANALCRTATAAQHDNEKNFDITKALTPEEFKRGAGTVLVIENKKLDDLLALGYPAGDEETLNTIYSHARATMAELQGIIDRMALDADLTAMGQDPNSELSVAARHLEDYQREFAAYGMTDCDVPKVN